MIRSMTGFGHGEVSNDKNQKVTVEMKSVNHRYCDISLKLPKKLAMFEANIRNIMKVVERLTFMYHMKIFQRQQ